MTVATLQSVNTAWKKFRLGEILTLINGRAYGKSEERTEGTPVLRIQNLNGGERWFYSDLNLPANKYCDNGDLLFAWSATFGPYIWWGSKVIYHYHIWKIECGPLLDKKFAFYLLQHITKRVKSAGRGISMLHMTKSGMEDWEVAIPPLPEQRRIAGILDQADALRRLRRQSLSRLSALGQAIFHEMFESEEAATWPTVPLVEVSRRITDGEHLTPKRCTSGFKLLSARNVRDGYVDYSNVDYVDQQEFERIAKRCRPQQGDVLISCSGSVGRVALIESNEPIVLVRSAALVIPDTDQIDPRYLSEYLRTQTMFRLMTKRANSSGQPNLFLNQIKELPIVLPPLARQKVFSRRFALAQCSLGSGLTSSNNSLNSLVTSLQHRAFRGEL